jgi:YD repeat-containing protein
VWDANSRLVSVSDDKGNTTSYTYDNRNRLVLITFADGTTHQFVYDKDSNLVQFTDNNSSVVNNTYDSLNRLVRKEITRANAVQGTTIQAFEFDGLSRLTRATDNNNSDTLEDDSVVERKYNSLSRLVEETQNGKVISSNWNEAGSLTDLTYPNERKLLYTQDQLDRLKTITSVGNSSPVASYDYLGSRLIERLFGNNTRLTMLNDAGNSDTGYDSLGRLTQLRHLGASNIQITGFRFGYNRENMKIAQDNLTHPNLSENYAYDSVYRLAYYYRNVHFPERRLDPKQANSPQQTKLGKNFNSKYKTSP